jgi:hypothetical protein
MRYVAAALLAALGGNEQNYFSYLSLRVQVLDFVKRSNAEINEFSCTVIALMSGVCPMPYLVHTSNLFF